MDEDEDAKIDGLEARPEECNRRRELSGAAGEKSQFGGATSTIYMFSRRRAGPILARLDVPMLQA